MVRALVQVMAGWMERVTVDGTLARVRIKYGWRECTLQTSFGHLKAADHTLLSAPT